MRRDAFVCEGLDAAENVGLVAHVQRLRFRGARQGQVFGALHGLVGQAVQEFGGTHRVHVVVDAEAAGADVADLFCIPKGVDAHLQGVATAVVEEERCCTIAQVFRPFTHHDFGAVDHGVHVPIGRQHHLKVVGQSRCKFVLPTGGRNADGKVDKVRAAEVPCTWAVADAAVVERPDARVNVVANAIFVFIGEAVSVAVAKGVREETRPVVGVGCFVVVASPSAGATEHRGDA